MSGYYIETDNITVGYDGKAVVDKVCFQVNRGQILTLIGPNGCGKSTILKSIVGQLKLLDGVIVLEGKDIRQISANEMAKTMAIVLTSRISPELMTCEDVVSTGRYPYTGRLGLLGEEDKKIVKEALEQVDAMDIADRPFSAISDGQRQRIMLARALCQQPQIIVLDEPTSFLDIRYKLELLSILKRMVREKDLAVIMSLHEIDLARRVSDQVACVMDGKIDRIGPPEKIFSKEYIYRLYHMDPERYDKCFETMEFV